MKKKTIFALLIGVLLLAYIIYEIGVNDIINLFNNFNPNYLIPYLLISLGVMLGLVLRWWIITRVYIKNISFTDLFLYKIGGFFISYITPSAKVGGEGVRIYFLMKEKNSNFDHATSSVITDKILELSTNGLFTIAGIIIFLFNYSISRDMKWILVSSIALITFLIFIYYYRIFHNKPVFYPILKLLRLNKLSLIKKNEIKIKLSEKKMILFHIEHKKTFFISVAISLILLILSMVEFDMLAKMFGYNFSYIKIMYILTFVGLAMVIPIPAGLGILEGTQVGLMDILAKTPSVGFGIAVLTRIRDSLWALAGFIYLWAKGIKYSEIVKKGKSDIIIDPRVQYFKKWKI